MARKRRRTPRATPRNSRSSPRVPGPRVPGPAQGGGPARMSDLLLDLLEPWIIELPDPPPVEVARAPILLAAIAWNVSRSPDAARREAEIREAARGVDRPAGVGAAEVEAFMAALVDRARALWPHLRQVILHVRVVEDEGGDLRIRAMSRVPPGAPDPHAAGPAERRRGTAAPRAEERVPRKTRPLYEAVVRLTDAFCAERLDGDYATLCRKMAATLARKRPSPLERGGIEGWACGIVRAAGSANFLFDPSTEPYVSAAEIAGYFGVAPSTCAAKARAVKDALRIRPYDWHWLLPGTLERNPLVWLVEVDGLLADARDLPLDLQEEAARRGLIPYAPGRRPVEVAIGAAEYGTLEGIAILDPALEQIIRDARRTPHGYILSGLREEFAALAGFLASEADYEPDPERRAQLRAAHEQIKYTLDRR